MERRADAGASGAGGRTANAGPAASPADLSEARHFAAIERLLELAATQVGLELACVGAVAEGGNAFPWSSGDVGTFGVAGRHGPALLTIARRIHDGTLPAVNPDLAEAAWGAHDRSAAATGIGAAIGVTITLDDGRPYGVLLCADRAPAPGLGEREEAMLRIYARAVAKLITSGVATAVRDFDNARISAALTGDVLGMVFQPIVSLQGGHAVGFEALARFGVEPDRSPDQWFAEAARAGRGVDLEIAAVRAALAHVPRLSEGEFLAVNASPETAASPAFCDEMLAGRPDRIVVELTNHLGIEDPRQFNAAFEILRAKGVRLAVDDAGGGFAALSQVVQLRPNIVKVDPLLVRDVHADPVRRSLVTAAVNLAREIDALTVAEGVEAREEAKTLLDLGIDYGQGLFIAPPGPLGGR